MLRFMRTFALLLLAVPSFASDFLFSTPTSQTMNGYPVYVTAAIDLINSTTMMVTLDNLENNPTADSQVLTSFTFSVKGNIGEISISSSAKTVGIDGSSPGDFTVSSSAGSSYWKTSATNASTTAVAFCDFDNPGCPGQGVDWSSYGLIGGPNASNAYANATRSQAMYDVTNPFLYKTVTFTVTGTNIPYNATLSDTISSVEFGFGGKSGQEVAGTYEGIAVHEPGAAWLLIAAASLRPAQAAAKRLRHRRCAV